MSEVQAYSDYIKKSEFETRNVFEWENIQMTRPDQNISRKKSTIRPTFNIPLTLPTDNSPMMRPMENIPLTRPTDFEILTQPTEFSEKNENSTYQMTQTQNHHGHSRH